MNFPRSALLEADQKWIMLPVERGMAAVGAGVTGPRVQLFIQNGGSNREPSMAALLPINLKAGPSFST